MAKRVFSLRDVSDEEAEDVRALLTDNQIEFYETSAGRWQISVAALWVRHDDDFSQARTLIDHYQNQRREQFRNQPPTSFWRHLFSHPVESVFVVVALLFVLGLSLSPFLSLN